MSKTFITASFIFLFILCGCSKKNHPSKTNPAKETVTVNASDSTVAAKPVVKRKVKVVIPKVITVNDSAAHKSVDGRLFYDVMGHRYWRNYNDGKYYLFNKSMYTDDAFKPK